MHPFQNTQRLRDAIAEGPRSDETQSVEVVTLMVSFDWASTRAGSPNNLSYGFRPDDPVQYFKMFYLWPNILFVIWPGAVNLGALTAVPLGYDQTIQRYDHYMLDDTPGESGDRAR